MTFIDFSEAMQIAAECRRWTLQCERLNWPKDLPETFSRPARSPRSPERCLENSRWGQQMLIVLDVFRGKTILHSTSNTRSIPNFDPNSSPLD